MNECIFCKIIRKEIPAKIEHEDEQVLAFYDIQPRARVHLLIIPKKHLPTMKDVNEEDTRILGHLLKTVSDLAKKLQLEHYNVAINVGENAGQEVFHLHLHLKSADNINSQ
jgi:histidine triad (HIT) family protein